MIVFAQAGQYGKTKHLFDMHRLRKKIFADRLKWDVDIQQQDLEVDDFDIPEAVYLLAIEENEVIGSWRLLSTEGPTMIRDVWPEFLKSLDMPTDHYVWEASRFGVLSKHKNIKAGIAHTNEVTKKMFQALTQVCMQCGIEYIYTLYDKRIARLLRILNCEPVQVSNPIEIDGVPCWVGAFKTDKEMLRKLQDASGYYDNLYNPNDLPPALIQLMETKDKIYA